MSGSERSPAGLAPFDGVRLGWRVLGAVARRPGLWVTALAVARRFAPDRWWRRPPFLPLPDPALVAFRSTTQYGDATAVPRADDLVLWLTWCRAEARRRRGE
ncbi:MAG: hypothetical protein ACE5GB_05440 [Acidimicrobiales bacterium]